MVVQLPLNVSLRDDASFNNFYVANNAAIVAQLENCVSDSRSQGSVFLWGTNSSGKTHLLEAACHLATEKSLTSAYVPLKYAQDFKATILDNLETCQLICLDDIDLIAGQEAWEQAIFHLYNRANERNSQMIFSSTKNIKECNFVLPDLVSRLGWGVVLHIQPLSDEEKIAALQLRASLRGFELPDNVINYLLRRCSRDTNALFTLLGELDKASLIAKRKLTIPLVKQWFENKKDFPR